MNNFNIALLNKLPPQIRKQYEPYMNVAKGMDTNFLNFLITKMRETIPKEESDSNEINYYNSLLDHEYAGLMAAQNKGKGTQELILNQILPHHLKANLTSYRPSQSVGIYEKVSEGLESSKKP